MDNHRPTVITAISDMETRLPATATKQAGITNATRIMYSARALGFVRVTRCIATAHRAGGETDVTWTRRCMQIQRFRGVGE